MILYFFLRMIDRNAAVAIPQFYCLAINEFARGPAGCRTSVGLMRPLAKRNGQSNRRKGRPRERPFVRRCLRLAASLGRYARQRVRRQQEANAGCGPPGAPPEGGKPMAVRARGEPRAPNARSISRKQASARIPPIWEARRAPRRA
jgi:hypothetical protein